MAMTGGTAYRVLSKKANYGNASWTIDLYIYVKQGTQNAKDNTTPLSLGMYVQTPGSAYDISWEDFDGSYLGIGAFNSGEEYLSIFTKGAFSGGTIWLKENVDVTVYHAEDGTAVDVPIKWKWGVNSPWGQYVNPSGTKAITLPTIDRKAPTVSCSVSNISTNSLKISASASTSCDSWDYSLDDGNTWTNFSTTDATTASKTVTGLEVNTSYNIKVRARRTYNNVYGTSSKVAAKTLGYSVAHSCPDFAVDASTVAVKPIVTVYDGSFSHYVTFKNGSTELFTTDILTWAAGKETRSITLTSAQRDTLLSAMTKDKTKDFTLEVKTYNGTTLIGSTSCTAEATTSAANSAPTFTNFTYLDTSDCVDVTGNDQILIQLISTLKVTAGEATAKNKASIVNYSATIANKTVKSSSTEITVGTVDASGTLDLTVSAIDSRGYSTSVTKKVKVLKYAKPKITNCVARRADGISDVIQLSFSGTMSVIKPDGNTDVNGFAEVSFRYKETSKADTIDQYSDTIAITGDTERSSDGTQFSFETKQLISLDTNFSYDLRIVVKDRVSSFVGYYLIPRGIPVVAIRKDKIGINNPTPQYAADVIGDIGLTGGLFKDGVNLIEDTGWISLGLADGISASEDNLGHYKGCAYRVIGGKHVYVAFNCAFTYSGEPITISKNSIPSDYLPEYQPTAFANLAGKFIARVFVDKDFGGLCVDWLQSLLSTEETTSRSVTWIDGYLDYWI